MRVETFFHFGFIGGVDVVVIHVFASDGCPFRGGNTKKKLEQKFLPNFSTHPVAAKFVQRLVSKSVTTSSVLVLLAEGLKEMGKRCISSSAWQTPEKG